MANVPMTIGGVPANPHRPDFVMVDDEADIIDGEFEEVRPWWERFRKRCGNVFRALGRPFVTIWRFLKRLWNRVWMFLRSIFRKTGKQGWETSFLQLLALFVILYAGSRYWPITYEPIWALVHATLLTGLYTAVFHREITGPNVGILYVLGVPKRVLKACTCLPLPLFCRIAEINMTEIPVTFLDPNILAGDELGIGAGGTVWIQANPSKMQLFLEQSPEDARKNAQQAALASLQAQVTKEPALNVLQRKEDLSKIIALKVTESLRGKVKWADDGKSGRITSKGGWTVQRIQLSDIDATALTDAASIKKRGLANAEVATLMRDALGDQAHTVQMVSEAGNAFGNLLRVFFRERRRDRKEDVTGDLPENPVDLLRRISESLEKLTGERKGEE